MAGFKPLGLTFNKGDWDKLRIIIQHLGAQELPSLVVEPTGVLSRDTDVTSPDYGLVTLQYDTAQFDEVASKLHIMHFHTPDTQSTTMGVDTENHPGSWCTLAGYQAGSNNYQSGAAPGTGADGTNNTYIGCLCGKGTPTLSQYACYANTGVGHKCLEFVNGSYRNAAFGYYALGNLRVGQYNKAPGAYNVALGAFCAGEIIGGHNNMAQGYFALGKGKFPVGNVAIGPDAGWSVSASYGAITAFANTGGGQVTVSSAGHNRVNGDEVEICGTINYNSTYTVAGVDAGVSFEITETYIAESAAGWWYATDEGVGNVMIGRDACQEVTIANYTTASGYGVGVALTIGNNNTLYGAFAGDHLTTGSGDVFLGYGAGGLETTGSNKLYIHNSNSATPLIYGEFDTGLVKIAGALSLAAGSIKDSSGTISFDNENLTTTGTLGAGLSTFSEVNIGAIGSTGTKLSIGTNNTTEGLSGLVEIVSDSSHLIPTATGLTIDAYFPVDATTPSYAIAGYFLNPSTGSFTSSAKIYLGLFGGASTSLSVADTSVSRSFSVRGLQFIASNDGDIAKSGVLASSVDIYGSHVTSFLGYPGKTISGTKIKGTNTTGYYYSNIAGTYNATTAGENYGLRILVADNLAAASTGNITSYGLHITTPVTITKAGGGVLTSWNIYSAGGNSAHAGNIRFGDTNVPIYKLEVNGVSRFGDGGTTNYMEVSVTGDVVFAGSSGLCFGEIYGHDVDENLAMDAQDTFYQIISFNTNGGNNNCTPDHTNDHITIVKTGIYKLFLNISASSATAENWIISPFKNNGATQIPCADIHFTSIAGVKEITMANSCLVSLTANDTIEVWAARTTGGAASKTLIINSIGLNIIQIGG